MDTRTSYMGLQLPHPFIAGASPFGYHLDNVRRLEEGGSAAVVLHLLFEEQLTQMTTGRIRQMDVEAPEFAEAISQFPNFADYELVTDLKVPSAAVEQSLVDVVRELKRVLRIPIAVKLTPFFTALRT
jgi:dihydroorotate dehydrogenase (fumarate)